MTLKHFIKQYDKEGSIVLLEGKRDVREEDKAKLTELGRLLAANTKHMLFRSGNAEGSDEYFCKGVAMIDCSRIEVITPYTGHRQKYNQAESTIALDKLNIAEEADVIYHSRQNKKTEKLIDQYVSGDVNRFSIKAAYILRDTIKAIGTDDIKPATFGIFYDDLENPKAGGTGHTMNVCEMNNIPVINQTEWFEWLGEN